MLQKTALQTLIEWGDNKLLKEPEKLLTFGEAIDKAVELLKKEQEQIEKAFDYRANMKWGSESQINTGKDYYTETYKKEIE